MGFVDRNAYNADTNTHPKQTDIEGNGLRRQEHTQQIPTRIADQTEIEGLGFVDRCTYH